MQIQQLTPKQGELAVKIGKGIVQNVFLQQSNTAFKALEYGEVISNQVVENVVNHLLKRGPVPIFKRGQRRQPLLDNAFFVQNNKQALLNVEGQCLMLPGVFVF